MGTSTWCSRSIWHESLNPLDDSATDVDQERRIFGDLTLTGVRGRRRLGTVPSLFLCTIALSLENYCSMIYLPGLHDKSLCDLSDSSTICLFTRGERADLFAGTSTAQTRFPLAVPEEAAQIARDEPVSFRRLQW